MSFLFALATLALNQTPREFAGEDVKLRVELQGREWIERLYVRDGRRTWREVLASPTAPGLPLEGSESVTAVTKESQGLFRSAPSFHFRGVGSKAVGGGVEVTLTSNGSAGTFIKKLLIPKKGRAIRVDFSADLKEKRPRLHSMLLSYAFVPDGKTLSKGGKPDSTFLPGWRPRPEQVVGDHMFRAPAAVAQLGKLAAIVMPDLDVLAENRPMETILDLDAKNGVCDATLLSYGFAGHKLTGHVYFASDMSQTRSVPQNLRLSMDILLNGDAVPKGAYMEASERLWARYGRRYFDKVLPQAMPFEEYAKVCYPAAFSEQYGDNKLGWFEHEIDGKMCGGVMAGWGYLEGAVSWQCWFNNLRSAWGLRWWGKKLGNADWVARADKMLNLALAAPMDRGAVPTSYNSRTRKWQGSLLMPHPDCYYDLPSMAWKGIWMLRFLEFEDCPRREEIVDQCLAMADLFVRVQNPDGSIPSWLDKDLKPVPLLDRSAQTALVAWFVLELGPVTPIVLPRIGEATMKALDFLANQVVDDQYYYDFETFFSCSPKLCAQRDGKFGHEEMRDHHSLQPPQNTLAMQWAAEALMKGANEFGLTEQGRRYRLSSMKALEMMNLYQNVWPISYRKTAYTYGGFGVQNSDGEYNDARQAQFGATLCDFGAQLGRQDLFERGVAAVRASMALINHPLHAEHGIYPNPNYPLGLQPENCCHGGTDHQAGRTGFDWGEGSGLTSMAWLLHKYGQGYVSPKGWAVGVDGTVAMGGGQFATHLLSERLSPLGPREIEVGGKKTMAEPYLSLAHSPTLTGTSPFTVGMAFHGPSQGIREAHLVRDDGATLALQNDPRSSHVNLTPMMAELPSSWLGRSYRVKATAPGMTLDDGPFTLLVDPVLDFKDMRLWTVSGSFADVPTTSNRSPFGMPPDQPFIGTCEDGRGGFDDSYTGTIVSMPFYVTKPKLRLLVGGGAGKDVYVELVNTSTGNRIASARGENRETMREVVWDVSKHGFRNGSGPVLQIRIVDRETGGWGHINVGPIRVTD